MLMLPSAIFLVALLFAPWAVWVIWSGFMSVRQNSLLSVMKLAVQRNMALDAGISAFAQTYSGGYRRRALALARLLHDGVPLGQALRKIPGLLSAQAQATADIGQQTGNLQAALQCAYEQDLRKLHGGSQLAVRLCYLAFVLAVSQGVFFFLSYYIVPKFKRIFADFGFELPDLTLTAIRLSDTLVVSGGVAVTYALVMLVVLAAPVVLFAAMQGYPLLKTDFLENMTFRSHCGTILRCLALALERNQPLPAAIGMVADHYPVHRIANRLHRAAEMIANGEDWLTSLRKTGVVSSTEANLLQASERSENLVWAMHMIADGSDRRHWYRVAMGMQLLGPAVVLACAVPIALTCVAMFLPLIQLINQLGAYG